MTSETTPGLRCAVRRGLSLGGFHTKGATSLTFPYRLLPRAVYGLQPQVYFLAHLVDFMARARLVTPLSLNVRAVPWSTIRVSCASFKKTGFGHVGPDSPAFKVD